MLGTDWLILVGSGELYLWDKEELMLLMKIRQIKIEALLDIINATATPMLMGQKKIKR